MNEIEVIKFKSFPKFWEKEHLGIKPNTLRVWDGSRDKRFQLLFDFEKREIRNLIIEVINTETKQSFKRRIKDVTFFNGMFIISW